MPIGSATEELKSHCGIANMAAKTLKLSTKKLTYLKYASTDKFTEQIRISHFFLAPMEETVLIRSAKRQSMKLVTTSRGKKYGFQPA